MKRAYKGISNDMDCSAPNKVMLVERTTNPGGVQLVNSYNATRSSTQDLVGLATEIQKADSFVQANAQNKLRVIAEQMQFLKKQAEKVLLEAKDNAALHHAACNFIKQPGNIYHLYEKPSGQCYFSMLSPEEWGDSGPLQVHRGSYRLEHDHSWTRISEIKSKDTELNIFNRCFSTNQLLGIDLPDAMSIDS